jgi:hypothetical protein
MNDAGLKCGRRGLRTGDSSGIPYLNPCTGAVTAVTGSSPDRDYLAGAPMENDESAAPNRIGQEVCPHPAGVRCVSTFRTC